MTDWYFSEEDRRLVSPERVVQLTAKAAQVFACLERHKGEIVSVDTVLEEVWAETHVTPDLVREYIHDLRIALGDDPRRPRYIETVRGKGFRLIGDIEPGADAAASLAQGEGEYRPTVAVLKPPLTQDPLLNDLADQVASEVINHLARFHYIGVVARQSAIPSGEIGDIRSFARDVNASYILEAGYTRLGDDVRTRVQLVEAARGRSLWGTRLDLGAGDAGRLVDDISSTIVFALTGWHGELHRAEYKSAARKNPVQLNAFEHFVLGCDLEMRLDADSLQRSIAHLEQSVRLDPTFSRAWLVYALELRWAYSVVPGRDRRFLETSDHAFRTAFKLAPTDPVNLALMAMNTARIGNLAGGLALLDRAEASMLGDSDAMVCVATAKAALTDDADGAVAVLDSVLRQNKTPPSWVYFAEAGIAFLSGDHERCISSSWSAPEEISAMAFRCLSLAMLGRGEEAVAEETKLKSTFPDFDFMRFADNFPICCPARQQEYFAAVERLMSSARG
ncbi:Transcriptional regulatory protein, C terminal [Roseivivax lentus]|uniref:Transcriptional regulatory protein, C terminal n=1 Tax=Roseivivax lentus TaxID=633194 RepID=A0A1N7NB70_9RHOB|nr:Transcriptional regulatory protein, C terminal [Roseivivax lentus]